MIASRGNPKIGRVPLERKGTSIAEKVVADTYSKRLKLPTPITGADP